MSFDLSDDQRALAAGIRELCAGRFAIEHVQSLEGAGFDADGWQALQDAGVFSLRLPEDRGGLGLGMVEAAIVYTELGRALVPGPLIGTQLAGGSSGWTGSVGDGPVGVVVPRQRPTVLAYPDVVGPVLVVRDESLSLVDRADVETAQVQRPLDPLTPLALVTSVPEGDRIGAAEDVARLGLEGAVLAAALQVGIAEAVTERSTAYAKEREQFGRPIGAFQAVKHLLADMVVRTEIARVAVHAAAVHLDDPGVGDVQRAVSGAKLLAGEGALGNAKAAVQVHGGMGFTWEVPIHLYLKRAAFLDVAFGGTDQHAAAVATAL